MRMCLMPRNCTLKMVKMVKFYVIYIVYLTLTHMHTHARTYIPGDRTMNPDLAGEGWKGLLRTRGFVSKDEERHVCQVGPNKNALWAEGIMSGSNKAIIRSYSRNSK